ncbi:MAG: hypothetical protein AB8B91_19140 [Rubripirellula sp.]
MARFGLFGMVFMLSVWGGGFAAGDEAELASVCRQIERHSGTRLVFRRDQLPPGRYYSIMKPLSQTMKLEAATICEKELRKYPAGYLKQAGLKVIGIFAACASKRNDGFHHFAKELGGYRYYGVYNGIDAVAMAYYDTGQLPMTLHHEIYHHVDATDQGVTESWQLSGDDAYFHAAVSGFRPYAAPKIKAVDLKQLRQRCRGFTLRHSVNEYSSKNAQEDQAESARYLMSRLPDSLVQIVDHPELPGSQRILHVLGQYKDAVRGGPGLDWFIGAALATTNEL